MIEAVAWRPTGAPARLRAAAVAAARAATAVALVSAQGCGLVGAGRSGPGTSPAPTPPVGLELLAESGAALEDGPIQVARVVDGDTLVVSRGIPQRKVRLIGINAPESVDPRRAVQCFGRQAAERAKELAGGRRVFLGTDPLLPRYDEYGRMLAYVWLDDGRLLNLALLAEGYANEYVHDPSTPYELRDEFRAARDQAAEDERGLWAPDTCAGDYNATPGPSAPSR